MQRGEYHLRTDWISGPRFIHFLKVPLYSGGYERFQGFNRANRRKVTLHLDDPFVLPSSPF